MTDLFEEPTVKSAWKSIFAGTWWKAIGRRWCDAEYPRRCEICGRRLGEDFIGQFTPGESKAPTRICYNHGCYEGQKVVDCFTGCEAVQHREPRFYRETAILHEIWFFVKAAFMFVRIFFRELPFNILQTLNWITRKAIKKQRERLGHK